MSTHADLADFVLGLLSTPPAGGWAAAFTAGRAWSATADAGDLNDPVVTVVPVSAERETAGRGADQTDFEVAVLLRRYLPDPDTRGADIDALDALAEQIMDAVTRRSPAAGPAFLALRRDPVVYDQDLEDKQTFTTVITATYRYVA